ncbi:transcriptional regulator RcsA [Ewingella sp. S1.OA.A_B6]
MQTIILDSCSFTCLGLVQSLRDSGIQAQNVSFVRTFEQLNLSRLENKTGMVFINEACLQPHDESKEQIRNLISQYPETLFFIFMSEMRIHFEEYVFVRRNVIISSKSIKTMTLNLLIRKYLYHHDLAELEFAMLDITPVMLSRSESNTLKMWMSGEGTIQISDKLHIKVKTVSSYKGSIKRKIKTANKHIIYHVVRLSDQFTGGIYVN